MRLKWYFYAWELDFVKKPNQQTTHFQKNVSQFIQDNSNGSFAARCDNPRQISWKENLNVFMQAREWTLGCVFAYTHIFQFLF